MTIRIVPGTFGYAEVTGADAAALALLAPLGFTPPRRAAHPVSLHSADGPLTRLALIAYAARRLEQSGYSVEVDPQLQLSPDAERALEVLADLGNGLAELAGLLRDMDDLGALGDVAGQMTTGRGNVLDGLAAAFTAGAEAAKASTPAAHPLAESHRAELATWYEAGAQAAEQLTALATATACPPPGTAAEAARTRSPATPAATSIRPGGGTAPLPGSPGATAGRCR